MVYLTVAQGAQIAFWVANDDHPQLQEGASVTVQFDPQDQFAKILMDKIEHVVTRQANEFFLAAAVTMENLYERWLDESEYEDIADYAEPLRPIAERCGVVIERMSSKPFSCVYTVDGKRFRASVNSRSYSYRRIQ